MIVGIIAIHNTTRGPALGGCRISKYKTFQEGLQDVLNLAEAMTYKNAIVDLPYGGGKAVIFENHAVQRSEVFYVFSHVLNSLKGIYLTADDVGTCVEDMEFMRRYTPYAKGVRIGDYQVPATSYGVYQAVKAAFFYKQKPLKNSKVLIQGLGKTGYGLCRYLKDAGCLLFVDDLRTELVEKAKRELGAKHLIIEREPQIDIDLFCPCAFGGTVNRDLLNKMNTHFIIGSANNQLENPSIADEIYQKKIIYIPDFLSNAGGVIDVFCEGEHYSEAYVFSSVSKIYNKTLEILRESEALDLCPLKIAEKYVSL